MSSVGTITASLHTVDRNETVYARPGHSVSHNDLVSFKRVPNPPGNGLKQLRLSTRFARSFPVSGATDGLERDVLVTVSTTVPPGIDVSAVNDYIEECLTQGAGTIGTVATTGDIHLGS